ncbi:MAG: DUF4403 family protein [Saprospiraceae bacterium]|nr:DUF4403 family protein [Saprospiraceae bacterium]
MKLFSMEIVYFSALIDTKNANMSRNYFPFFVIILILTLSSCKTTKPVRPMEQYDDFFEEKTSILNIPIRIDAKELQYSLNQQMDGLLYEDDNIKDDNLMVKASKKEDIELEIDSQLVKYKVPLALWIKYDAGITNVQAEGAIALDFKTAFTIQNNWELETTTEIVSFDWIQKPKVKLIGVSLPIGFIADLILNNSKSTITKAIDEQVKANLDLPKVIGDAWKQMHDPLLISPEYNAWLTVNPTDIGMTPLRLDDDKITSTVVVQSKPRVMIGQKPAAQDPFELPDFEYRRDTNEDFEINIQSEITYEEAERIGKMNLVGETFSSGKRAVTIQDLNMYGKGNKLIVSTKMTGSYNGEIYMEGKPVYNAQKNTIDIKDLDFTLDTRNFLYKSASWLLKSTIKNKVQENLDFLLDANMNDLKDQMAKQLENYPITKGITLKGELADLAIQNAYLAQEGIKVFLSISGKLNVDVTGLN